MSFEGRPRVNNMKHLFHLDTAWKKTTLADIQMTDEWAVPPAVANSPAEIAADEQGGPPDLVSVETVMSKIVGPKKSVWVDSHLKELKAKARLATSARQPSFSDI